MVLHFPAFFAIRQQSRFSSSEPVTAIRISASLTPASICAWMLAPLPTIRRASMLSGISCMRLAEASIMTTSWFSWHNCSARVIPTLPPPMMIHFIISLPSKVKNEFRMSRDGTYAIFIIIKDYTPSCSRRKDFVKKNHMDCVNVFREREPDICSQKKR